MNSSTVDERGRAGVPQDVRNRAGFDDGDSGRIVWKETGEDENEFLIELVPDDE